MSPISQIQTSDIADRARRELLHLLEGVSDSEAVQVDRLLTSTGSREEELGHREEFGWTYWAFCQILDAARVWRRSHLFPGERQHRLFAKECGFPC